MTFERNNCTSPRIDLGFATETAFIKKKLSENQNYLKQEYILFIYKFMKLLSISNFLISHNK